jgi:hypothetical protein
VFSITLTEHVRLKREISGAVALCGGLFWDFWNAELSLLIVFAGFSEFGARISDQFYPFRIALVNIFVRLFRFLLKELTLSSEETTHRLPVLPHFCPISSPLPHLGPSLMSGTFTDPGPRCRHGLGNADAAEAATRAGPRLVLERSFLLFAGEGQICLCFALD